MQSVHDTNAHKKWIDALSSFLLAAFVEDLVLETCVDHIWEQRMRSAIVGHFYIDDTVYEDSTELRNTAIHGATANTANSSSGVGTKAHSAATATVTCPICQELVGGQRFAPHLEKCMNGGKRGSRKYSEIMLEDPYYAKAGKLKPTDMHPNSLVVKIKVKNFIPRGYQKRKGATVEEFQQGTQGSTRFSSASALMPLPASAAAYVAAIRSVDSSNSISTS